MSINSLVHKNCSFVVAHETIRKSRDRGRLGDIGTTTSLNGLYNSQERVMQLSMFVCSVIV